MEGCGYYDYRDGYGFNAGGTYGGIKDCRTTPSCFIGYRFGGQYLPDRHIDSGADANLCSKGCGYVRLPYDFGSLDVEQHDDLHD
jgi:hypothetical protein